ncbi:hypothetical protein LWI28_007527 [Acer negundo]|uniref:MULE transposase domain-containing protein n=1 Tax=Acer negundo TaxID=4023 RepID=A0AAD5ICP5_ACENE|nr:hypothetical protein LWI28_007527 [Acer negundo]
MKLWNNYITVFGNATSGFFDPYTMVVYNGDVFVYADYNIVGYTEGLCDIFKEAEVMSIMDLDKMCWLHECKNIIGLDACHVKSYHKAQLLWAIGIDADNSYYPIAYVVVEKEWHESWSWFLKLLKEDLNLEDSLGITFMTDRQKALVESIGDIWPTCEHRFCVRHMYANFKKKFEDDIIRGKLWKKARLTKVEDFQTCMAEIKELNENA